MQVNPSDFSCCAGWDFVCPGTRKVARLDGNGGLKTHSAKLSKFLLAFLLCLIFSSVYPIDFSLFLKSHPRAI